MRPRGEDEVMATFVSAYGTVLEQVLRVVRSPIADLNRTTCLPRNGTRRRGAVR